MLENKNSHLLIIFNAFVKKITPQYNIKGHPLAQKFTPIDLGSIMLYQLIVSQKKKKLIVLIISIQGKNTNFLYNFLCFTLYSINCFMSYVFFPH